MKKNYIAPDMVISTIQAETLICISVMGDDKKADGSTVLSKEIDFGEIDAEDEDLW